jgi:NADH:ubiquinone oxidoreductase subunit E
MDKTTATKSIPFEEMKSLVQQAITHHGKSRDALIPILNDINQAYGYIPAEAFKEVKHQINSPTDQVFVSESQLYGLATFYKMLSTKPVGRHVIRFCESAPCHVMGGRLLIQALIESLQLRPGETSSDGRWTLLTTSCLGTCGVGPVLWIDDDIYGNVTAEQLPDILGAYA